LLPNDLLPVMSTFLKVGCEQAPNKVSIANMKNFFIMVRGSDQPRLQRTRALNS